MRGLFRDADDMVATLGRISERYPGKDDEELPALPAIKSVRLAINVAACDQTPLAIVYAKDAGLRNELAMKVRRLAWSDEFRGRLLFAIASTEDDVKTIDGANEGLLVVQAESFGRGAKLLVQADPSATSTSLANVLRKVNQSSSNNERSFGEHIRDGRRQGVFWETRLPVTDPMELRARSKGPPPR